MTEYYYDPFDCEITCEEYYSEEYEWDFYDDIDLAEEIDYGPFD